MRRSSSYGPRGSRFDLLCLEDGEFFLEDVAAIECKLPFAVSHSPRKGALATLVGNAAKGRLKICSRSLLFDPEDSSQAIRKYSLRGMQTMPTMFNTNGDHSAQQLLGSQLFVVFCSDAMIEMREDGIHAPYKNTAAPAMTEQQIRAKQKEPMHVRLYALLHSNLGDVLPLIEKLWQLQQTAMKSSLGAEAGLLRPMLGERLLRQFDNSLLVDFTERPLLPPTGYRISRILPLITLPGLVMLTNRRLYIQPSSVNNVGSAVLNFPIRDVMRAYPRRHMLRECGAEIFFKPRQSSSASRGGKQDDSVLLSFENRAQRDNFLARLQSLLPDGERQPTVAEMCAKWQRREIDNYTYLSFLNSSADRSFHDLTQYPVFPWVLTNYTSAELDLSDENVYRDLSKPIGALNQSRLEMFLERYRDMPTGMEDQGIPPPFMYGTHYSTPGYVLFYMTRVAPAYMLKLQNGRFDAPDRAFFGIQDTWNGVMNGTGDLKELTPEFFDKDGEIAGGKDRCGDFLKNSSELNLGVRQTGQRVDDVILPPWAHGNANTFVEKMRAALESDYVSNNLHKWIDLIFGYKQSGQEAVKANNLFYWLTYEGAVDLDAVTDPVEKASLEAQISEFGQCPKQLFRAPHACRNDQPVDTTKAKEEPPAAPAASQSAAEAQQAMPTKALPLPELKSVADSRDAEKDKKASPVTTGIRSRDVDTDGTRAQALAKREGAVHAKPLKTIPGGNQRGSDHEHTKEEQLWQQTERAESHKGSGGGNLSNVAVDGAEMQKSKIAASSERATSSDGDAGSAIQSTKLRPSETDEDFFARLDALPQLPMSKKRIHRGRVSAITASIDGENDALYSVSHDTTLKIHALEGSDCVQKRSAKVSTEALSGLLLLPDSASPGSHYQGSVASSWDGSISILRGGKTQQRIQGAHEDGISCMAESSKGTGSSVVTGSWDMTVSVWKWRNGHTLSTEPLVTFYDHDTEIASCAMRGDLVLSGGVNGAVVLHDMRDADSPILFMECKSGITALSWIDDEHFVLCDESGTLQLHDARSGWAAVHASDPGAAVSSLCVLENSCLTGRTDGTVSFWNFSSAHLEPLWQRQICSSEISSLWAGEDGRFVVGDGDGIIYVY
eukprot:g2446.t1